MVQVDLAAGECRSREDSEWLDGFPILRKCDGESIHGKVVAVAIWKQLVVAGHDLKGLYSNLGMSQGEELVREKISWWTVGLFGGPVNFAEFDGKEELI